jgi:dihydrofolate reductase
MPSRASPRTSAFLGLSLDGFIARPDGALDFLDGPPAIEGEDYGYRAFMARVDAVVMGRRTFETVLSFRGWPYGGTPVFVLSRRGVKIPKRLEGKAEALSGTPASILRRLRKRGYPRLYIDGGQTVQGFLRAGLLDEITLTRIPVAIGRGIPLFGPLPRDVQLRHVRTRAFANGLVQSRYEVVRGRR